MSRYEEEFLGQLDSKRKYQFKKMQRRKRKTPERDLQKQVAKYLYQVMPDSVDVAWTAVEVSTGTGGAIRQVLLKQCGVRTGWPDVQFFWAHPEHKDCTKGLCIELKSKDGTVKTPQGACHKLLSKANIPTEVCRTLDEVVAALKKHGVPTLQVYFK